MAGPYTVDASVFLNAFNPGEPDHDVSFKLIARMQAQAVPIVVPTLLLPEVAGTIARGRGDSELARRFAATLRRLRHIVLVPLDAETAQQAANVAARHRLRGSDAVYAAIALRFATTLITLDQDQRLRVSPVLRARLPAEVRL